MFYTALWDTLIAIGYPLSVKISKNIANLQYRERQCLSKSNIFKTKPLFPLKILTVPRYRNEVRVQWDNFEII